MHELNEKIDQILVGFPNGDPDSYRWFPEAIIHNRDNMRQWIQYVFSNW
jgi:hypothetical protein